MIKAFIERVLPRKKPVRVEHSGKALGIHSEQVTLPADTAEADLLARIDG